jgi:hypothetical protein
MKLEQRIKRLEEAMGREVKEEHWRIIFWGDRDRMPKESFRVGNIVLMPTHADDLVPVGG